MLIGQISDTHIKPDGQVAYGRVDTASKLQAVIRHLNDFIPKISVVLITGDLADRGEPDEYLVLREILGDLEAPWFVVPGNHDNRENFLEAFSDNECLHPYTEFAHYAIEDFPIRLLGLDTTVPGRPYGWLCPARLAWLDQTLGAVPKKPTFLFQHHPPFYTGIQHMDVQNLRNADKQFEVLGKHSQVCHIACGHVHRACETTIQGIGVSIAPNVAHAVTLDLNETCPASFVMEPAAVRLFVVNDAGNVASHLSFIGSFSGPHPFFTEDGKLID